MFNRMAADILLATHVLVVAFVVGGQALIVAGRLASWGWVRHPWFRAIHLATIGIVLVQSWTGRLCFLTTWEMSLRRQVGDSAYSGSFISHWLSRFLYFEAPYWVFVVAYSAFGALVVVSWFWVRPHSFRNSQDHFESSGELTGPR